MTKLLQPELQTFWSICKTPKSALMEARSSLQTMILRIACKTGTMRFGWQQQNKLKPWKLHEFAHCITKPGKKLERLHCHLELLSVTAGPCHAHHECPYNIMSILGFTAHPLSHLFRANCYASCWYVSRCRLVCPEMAIASIAKLLTRRRECTGTELKLCNCTGYQHHCSRLLLIRGIFLQSD